MLTQKKCPHCGAIDSLDVDYLRGEVACNECAIVCETGLLEDPRTVWDDDGTVIQAHGTREVVSSTTASRRGGGGHQGRGGAAGAGGARSVVERSKQDARSGRAFVMLKTMRDATGVAEAVVESAQGYFEAVSARETARNSGGTQPAVLAAACFHIAATLRHFPIPLAEIAALQFLSVTASKVDAAKRNVLTELALDSEWRAAVQPEPHVNDLMVLYGRRLRPQPMTPRQAAVAAALCLEFVARYSHRDERVAAAWAIFATLHNRTAPANRLREAAGIVLPPADSGAGPASLAGQLSLVTAACKLTTDADAAAVRRCVEELAVTDDMVASAIGRIHAAAAAPATTGAQTAAAVPAPGTTASSSPTAPAAGTAPRTAGGVTGALVDEPMARDTKRERD